ncbi:response regulator [Anabaena cylindrica FACHB-243]|uniref:Protein PatA n=1 Tax=Anabaena cylindrica (strain ATCC 27899 / PCC 7122) TaxID=272123 RepID=K9ZBC8_ANACC|nr:MULTISPECIES: response regulator [Anabaena]AFZ55902.1 response regulator receiver protein [Anabaena cylindrica PCC 7122]MBD2421325.1 response regulator [Anabaena cylindrica FACHB-243]MBY5280895.1 response regulator [Anabaena sp. CCAP 1446/1C]MBY5310019.1 response regulator [Anabaena sp. CCAP 1446/1C]MCM2406657.1 response regulator [Anabaena sp. CCAP 1446/1C]
MNNTGTFSKLSPERLLRQLTNSSDTTCLQVLSNSVSWSIFLDQGKIIYATHSVEPFDRLERQMRRLSQQIPLLTNEVRVQLRMSFEPDWPTQLSESNDNFINQPPEYQAIYWLVDQKHLLSTQAALLIQELVKEVIESFLLIPEGTYKLTEPVDSIPKICKLDVENIMERCQKRLQSWQSFIPQISSPYQRPYLLINSKFYDKQLPELQQNLTNWMKGFSLRHLAVIMNQDEVELARTLYPHILQGSIILHAPDPPFDTLPKTFADFSLSSQYGTTEINQKLSNTGLLPDPSTTVEHSVPEISVLPQENLQLVTIPNNIEPDEQNVNAATITAKKTYKIISVDDSPTILKEISRCLEDENVIVVTINDPVKAVMSIIRHKPDLILLDLNMAGIDGYELCRIIRNNSFFKEIPIIFVTGNKGIVDKVKARLVGASGYLTKPFTRAELLKMIFVHLA